MAAPFFSQIIRPGIRWSAGQVLSAQISLDNGISAEKEKQDGGDLFTGEEFRLV